MQLRSSCTSMRGKSIQTQSRLHGSHKRSTLARSSKRRNRRVQSLARVFVNKSMTHSVPRAQKGPRPTHVHAAAVQQIELLAKLP